MNFKSVMFSLAEASSSIISEDKSAKNSGKVNFRFQVFQKILNMLSQFADDQQRMK